MQTFSLLIKKITKGFYLEILDILSVTDIFRVKNLFVYVLFLIGLFLSIASFLSLLSLIYIGIGFIIIVSTVSTLYLTYLNKKSLDNYYIGRHFRNTTLIAIRGQGPYLYTRGGRRVYDASGGASAVSLGRNVKSVNNVIKKQLDTGLTYSGTMDNYPAKLLTKMLVKSTGNLMGGAYLTGSGSEGIEAAIKMALQYFYEKNKNTKRILFITRETSYHGNTIGALSLSGFKTRRAPFESVLTKNIYQISSCNPYRQLLKGETNREFVERKSLELNEMFKVLGPGTVAGFVMEPVVGAALGCVPCVPGYLKAMRDICHKHGALFILDEVMCGMGRVGTVHAWQKEGIVPDLQVLAKGLGGGYLPISAVLVSKDIINTFKTGSGYLNHGQTYQSYPLGAVVGLKILSIISEKETLNNINVQGTYLETLLKAELAYHPNVGDIRGQGLFWGIEFVADKLSKKAFSPDFYVAHKIAELAKSAPYNMSIYPGQGCVDGIAGDHIIISPPLNINKKEVEHIAKIMYLVINSFFNDLNKNK